MCAGLALATMIYAYLRKQPSTARSSPRAGRQTNDPPHHQLHSSCW